MDTSLSPVPIPVVIDCDPGVDDAMAILLALGSPEIELRAITTVCGNVPLAGCTANALRILELAGRTDIPVHAGADAPLIGAPIYGRFHGPTGLGGLSLPAPSTTAQPEHAVEKLASELRRAVEAGKGLTICALGPMTNLALLLKLHPDLKSGIDRVVSMGGAFRSPGNRSLTSEFNVLADPHAARIVYEAGIACVALPLDVTHQAMTTPERCALFAGGAPGSPLAAAHALLERWARHDPARYGGDGGPMHDPLVTAFLVAPSLFHTAPAGIFVETDSPLCYGQTVADWYGRSGTALIATKVDADGFYRLLAERIARLERMTA